MTTRIGVISDTHLTSSAGLSRRIRDRFDGVDHILHAGDVVVMSVIRELEKIAPVSAVSGNMDRSEVKGELSRKLTYQVEDVKIGLIHGHGVSGHILDRRDYDALHDFLLSQFNESVDCIVYGHTHVAMSERRAGVLFLNPGTATGRGAKATVGLLTVDGSSVSVDIVDVD